MIHSRIIDKTFYTDTLLYKGKTELSGLQILKFLCALFVVQIHYSSIITPYIKPITRVAVPIFFMVTGYFLLDSCGKLNYDRIKHSFIKILKLTVIVSCIYILWDVALYIHHTGSVSKYLSIYFWREAICFGDNIGQRGHLWYLVSLMQAFIILMFCVRFKIFRWLLWVIPIGLMINLIIGSYNFIIANLLDIHNDLVLSRNVLTIGLPCVLIGILIRRYEHLLPQQRNVIIGICIFVIGIYVESIFLARVFPKYQGDIVIFTVPAAIAIFVFFLRFPVKSKLGKRLAYLGKVYSLDIYMWHVMVGTVILSILFPINIKHVQAFVIIILTLMVALALKRIGIKNFYS